MDASFANRDRNLFLEVADTSKIARRCGGPADRLLRLSDAAGFNHRYQSLQFDSPDNRSRLFCQAYRY